MKLTNQHGDILLYKLDELPASWNSKKVQKTNQLILAEGEEHNHFHVLGVSRETAVLKDVPKIEVTESPEIEFFRDASGRLFFKTETEMLLTHEEHKPQVVTPGIYEVGKVQEYDYDSHEKRSVID